MRLIKMRSLRVHWNACLRFVEIWFMVSQIEHYLLTFFTDFRIQSLLPWIHMRHLCHWCFLVQIYTDRIYYRFWAFKWFLLHLQRVMLFKKFWPKLFHFVLNPLGYFLPLPILVLFVSLFFRLRKITVEHPYDKSLWLPTWRITLVSLRSFVVIEFGANVDFIFGMLEVIWVFVIHYHFPF